MANIKSAKKRITVNKRQKDENKFFKATVNTYIKKFRKLVAEGNLEAAEAQLKETIKLIDSSASKGIYHRNNASRKVSRLTSALHIAKNGKTEEVVAPVVEEEVTAPVVEEVKAPAKKTTTKKAVTAETEEVAKPKTTRAKKATTETEEVAKPKTTRAKKAE